MAESIESKRERLTLYLAKSKRLQRRLKLAGPAIGAVAIALAIIGVPGIVWGLILALDVAVSGAGLWITFGHILDFQHQLAALSPGPTPSRRPEL